ncbi:hypothetical protein L484_000266 [Morus notabilis]|uniref:Uncharacterized protein n=1 Tax=Morus notabilis TaxID=981085 RepID=W9R6W4_9ROSA|nr:hypothetical protein L484_011014 [Morus notabilis]EXC44368.1 hypothetical protein L484_000266 [Morus notabilis]
MMLTSIGIRISSVDMSGDDKIQLQDDEIVLESTIAMSLEYLRLDMGLFKWIFFAKYEIAAENRRSRCCQNLIAN